MLFNLYSEFMIQEAMEGVEEIGFGGVNITNLRYADDAVLVAEKSWITEDARSDEDIRARVGMAKASFWQNKELMRSNIRLSTKMKILNCYVFSVLDYGCESWTWNSPMRMKVNTFGTWCYRMILG